MKSFFIVVVLMLRNTGAQTRIGGAQAAKESRAIKKLMDQLKAADSFGVFLSLGLGKPEQLSGYEQITYSLHVSANVRLIIELNATQDTIKICEEIKVEGVSDYHGRKDNWYIP